MFATGLRARLGTRSRPSLPMEGRWVRWLDADLDARYRAATTPSARRELAQAGLANSTFWLLWLRSSELFDTDYEDMSVRPPVPGELRDHLMRVGSVGWQLQPETKSERSRCVDTIAAYRTVSGLSIGKWALRAKEFGHEGLIFCHPNGKKWTSQYYRQKFLYPALYELQRLGDPGLQAFDDTPGNRIEDKFWSLHCYRRGARTAVSLSWQLLDQRYRRASTTEIYVHARWSTARSSEPIDKQYLHWNVWQRLQITLCCM